LQFSVDDLKRFAWHSRRGMLELDLILVPFVEKHLASLDVTRLQQYQYLLAQEDQDLFVWFLRRAQAPTPELQDMVDFILSRH
jgi:antitoxin CptB